MSSKTLLGFVAGAAVGALAGILFAPDSGPNTRKKIAHKAGDWTDAAKESFGSLIDGVKNAYTGAKDEAEELGDKAKSKFNTAKSEFNTAKTDAKNTFS